jgi:hypothetical protein
MLIDLDYGDFLRLIRYNGNCVYLLDTPDFCKF